MSTNLFRKKTTHAVAAIAVLGLVLGGCGVNSASSVVATYKGGTMTAALLDEQTHLNQLFDPQLTTVTTAQKKQLIQQYIVYQLMQQKALQAGVQVTSAQVNQTVLNIEHNAIQSLYSGSSSAFDSKMQSLNLNNNDVADYVKTALILQAYSKKLVSSVSVQDEQKYYQQNEFQFATVSVRHILVNSLPLAKKIASELQSGESWTTLAKQYSTDAGSKDNGGLYANANPAQWVVPFRQHAMSQPLGVVGQPFKSQYGYHVMEVLKRTVKPFKSVQATIQQTLLQQNTNTVMNNMYLALEKSANIKITLS